MKQERLKELFDYDAQLGLFKSKISNCENCTNYRGEMLAMRSSRYKRVSAQCMLYEFSVMPAAICNTWQGKDGAVLSG